MYRLIYPNVKYFEKFKELCNELHENGNSFNNFSAFYTTDADEYVLWSEKKRKDYRVDSIPESIFWLLDNEEVIGIGILRHYINSTLENYGGHISYIVRPARQGLGWGAVLLQLLINEAGKIGIKSALITCDSKNTSAVKLIKKAGGDFIGMAAKVRRFLVDTGIDHKYWRMDNFRFSDISIINGTDIYLSIDKHMPEDVKRGWCPSYVFDIRLMNTGEKMGYIDLRIGNDENLYYSGNIGYNVSEQYRGNHYAAKAVVLLDELAKRHNMNNLEITCNPDNIPSRKTCERVGGKLLEIVRIPKYSEQYARGDRFKCRYIRELK